MSHKSSTPGCEGTKYLPHGVTTEHFQEGLSTIGLGVRAKKDTTPRHTFLRNTSSSNGLPDGRRWRQTPSRRRHRYNL